MRINKKFIAWILAGAIFAAPVAGLAEGPAELVEDEANLDNEQTDEDVIKYAQIQEFAPLTIEEYEKLLERVYNYLKGRLPNSNSQKDFARYTQCLECLLYNVNIDYVKEEKPFIEASYVHGADGDIGRFQNLVDADPLIRDIQDNNQSVIKNINEIVELKKYNFENVDKELFHKYLVKVTKNKKYNLADAVVDYNNFVEEDETKVVIIDGKACIDYKSGLSAYLAKAIKDENYDIAKVIKAYIDSLYEGLYEKLVDPSEFCYNEDDAVILHELFIKWIDAYGDLMVLGISPVESEAFQELFRQLATLGSEEGLRNINETSTGAEWIGQKIIGVSTWEMAFEVLEKMDASRIPNYFDVNDNYKYIEGSVNPNCHDEYEAIVLMIRDLKKVAVDTVNNKIMTVLASDCLEGEKTK